MAMFRCRCRWRPVPSSSQHTSLPARAVPSARFLSAQPPHFVRTPSRRQHPHSPAGVHTSSPFRRPDSSVGRAPNHALQRTEAGGQVFRVGIPSLPRQPVAELESVRRSSSLPWFCEGDVVFPFGSRAASVPVRSVVAVCLPGSSPASFSLSSRQRPSFPRLGGRLFFRSPALRSHAPNNALQRTAG